LKIKQSKEQKKIIKAISLEKYLKVVAYAGTGKTTTLELLAREYPEERILYLVFNNANAEEASQRFPRNTYAFTLNKLAYQHIKTRTSINLRKVRKAYKAKEISDIYNVSFEDAQFALNVFENYCNSNSHTFLEVGEEEVVALPKKMFADMVKNKLDCTHSFYMKFYHLQLIHNPPPRMNYTIAMIDEAQDTNMVTLDIFLRLNIEKKIFVGDGHQQIYAFRGAKDIMEKVEGFDLTLSETFRFNQEIADIANIMLNKFKGDKNKITTKVKTDKTNLKTLCYLSRTNSNLVSTINELILQNKKFRTVKNPVEIFALLEEIYYLGAMKRGRIKKNKYLLSFKNIGELEEYAADIDDVELKTGIKVIEEYGSKIFDLKKVAEEYYNSSEEIDISLATAHLSKGLEWDTVILSDDYPDFIKLIKDSKYTTMTTFRKNIKRIDPLIVNEFNLFYVAVTRAKQELIIESSNKEFLTMTDKDINELVKQEKGYKKK
jgi:ATP-dependent exoDNAse (exonuclease V) beta subunit